MRTRTSDTPLALTGVPDGLEAYPVYTFRSGPDGVDVPVKTRRGLLKVRTVQLANRRAGAPTMPDDPFLLGAATRRWDSISARYGDTSLSQAVSYACEGLVELIYAVDDMLRLGRLLGWTLTPAARCQRDAVVENRAELGNRLGFRAVALAAELKSTSPAFTLALRMAADRRDVTRLTVMVFAAEDLLEGVVHDGPRAFSQAHYGNTKLRDDVEALLLAAGVPDEFMVSLGLRRSRRFGVAGVVAHVDDSPIELHRLPGLLLVPTSPEVRYRRAQDGAPVVLVENLQAAEALFRRYPNLVVIYTAGLPSQDALRHFAEIGQGARRTAVIPDADLGGVRIAEAALTALPAADVLDIGVYPHPERAPFAPGGITLTELPSHLCGSASTLAAAVLGRGYPVEQELAIVAAVADWIGPARQQVQGVL
jgi:hypothetical protein